MISLGNSETSLVGLKVAQVGSGFMTRGVWGEYGRMEGAAPALGTAIGEEALME